MARVTKKISISLIIFLLLIHSCSGIPENKQNFQCRLYQGYKLGKMDEWVRVMDELENQYSHTRGIETLLLLTQTQYGYTGYLIGAGKNKEAKLLIIKAEKNVERLLASQPKWVDVLALRASFLAYGIALNPFKAPFAGPKSMSLVDEALALNPQSVQANIEKGNALHYAPAMFGGNPGEAIKYYKKSIELMEMEGSPSVTCSWQHLNALTQLALAYEKNGSGALADATYRQILLIAPDFKWVKDELYPKFKKRVGSHK